MSDDSSTAGIFATLIGQCLLLFFASFGFGVLPLRIDCNPRLMKLLTTFGTGLLIGTAFLVIIPEGMHSIYSARGTGGAGGGGGHSHGSGVVGGSTIGEAAAIIAGTTPFADSAAAVAADNRRAALPQPHTGSHSHTHDESDGHDHSVIASQIVTRGGAGSGVPNSEGGLFAGLTYERSVEEEAKARFIRRPATASSGGSSTTPPLSGTVPAAPSSSSIASHSAHDGHSHAGTPIVTRTRIGGGPTRRLLQQHDTNDEHDHSSHAHAHDRGGSRVVDNDTGAVVSPRATPAAPIAGPDTSSSHDDGHAHSHGEDGPWQVSYVGIALAGGFLGMLILDRVMSPAGGHSHGHTHGGGEHSHLPSSAVDDKRSADHAIELGQMRTGGGDSKSADSAKDIPIGGSGGGGGGGGALNINANTFFNPVLVGLVMHCAVDGLAMGIVASTGQRSLSRVVFIAILAHKIPSAFGLALYLRSIGTPLPMIHRQLAVFCAVIPSSAILVWLIARVTPLSALEPATTGLLLLVSGGTFLYTVAVHVLPELGRDERTGQPTDAPVGWSNLIALAAGTFVPMMLHVDHSH